MLWAHVQAMRADAHTHGPIVRRRDEKFIVLMISFNSREEVNMSPFRHAPCENQFPAINNHHMNSNTITSTALHSRTADRLPSDAPGVMC